MSKRDRRLRLLALADQERRARNLLVCCRALGDVRGFVNARRDLDSIKRAEKVLLARRVEPVVVVQAAA